MNQTHESILSAEGSLDPVKTLAAQVKELVSAIATGTLPEADFGEKCAVSLAKLSHSGWWQKMSGGSCQLLMFPGEAGEDSELFSQTWPHWGIVLAGVAMELPMLAPRIKGTGSSLSQAWPTPRANKIGGESSPEFGPTLEQVAKNWPMPRASDGEHGGPNQRDSRGNYALPGMVQPNNWPTPTVRGLDETTDPAQGRRLKWHWVKQKALCSGQLSADWCELLMNFPLGWTNLDCDTPEPWPGWPAPLGAGNWPTPQCFDATSGDLLGKEYRGTRHALKLGNCINSDTGQFPYEPPRIIAGQKNRAKRLKCLGNSCVPAQAAPIFAAIMERGQ